MTVRVLTGSHASADVSREYDASIKISDLESLPTDLSTRINTTPETKIFSLLKQEFKIFEKFSNNQ